MLGSSAFLFFGSISGKIFLFILQLLLVRTLDTEHYAAYVISIGVINILVIVSSMGLSQASIRYLSIYGHHERDDLAQSLMILIVITVLCIGLILSALGYWFFDDIDSIFFKYSLKDSLYMLLPIVSVLALFNVLSESLKGLGRPNSFTVLRLVFYPLFLLIFSYFFIQTLNKDLSSVILAQYMTVFFFLLLVLYAIFHFIGLRFNIILLKEVNPKKVFLFSAPIMFNSLMVVLFQKSDIFMLGYFSDSLSVSVYSVITQFNELLVMPLTSIAAVFSITISTYLYRQKSKELGVLSRQVSKWIVLVTMAIYLSLILYGNNVLLAYKDEFIFGGEALVILATSYMLLIPLGLSSHILIYSGMSGYYAKVNLFFLTLNVILNYVLIPKYGIEGAAISTGLSMFLSHIVFSYTVYNKFNITLVDLSTLKIMTIGLFVFIFFKMAIPVTETILGVIVGSAFVLLLVVLLAIAARVITSQDIGDLILIRQEKKVQDDV